MSGNFFQRWARLKGASGQPAVVQVGALPAHGDALTAHVDARTAHVDARTAHGDARTAHDDALPANVDALSANGARSAPTALADAHRPAQRVPTLDDVAALGVDSDYSAFMAQGVDKSVQRLAMKKLFTDPHFNVMDRLDIYIDDYNVATPVSATMLAALGHAQGMLARGAELQARTDAAAVDAAAADAAAADAAAADAAAADVATADAAAADAAATKLRVDATGENTPPKMQAGAPRPPPTESV